MKKRLYLCTVILLVAVIAALWADFGVKYLGNDKAATVAIPGSDSSTVIRVPYEEPGIEAAYPMLQTGGTEEQRKLWNTLIYQEFDKILKIYSFQPIPAPAPSPGDRTPVILTIDYVVKENTDRILSIIYFAAFNYKYSAHPTGLAYTTNIDKMENKRVRLPDLIEINQEFLQYFRTWDYVEESIEKEIENEIENDVAKDGAEDEEEKIAKEKIEEDGEDDEEDVKEDVKEDVEQDDVREEIEQAVRDYIANISNEELALGFLMADQIGSQNLYGIYSYYTDDTFGVIIEVPNYLGDYARFETDWSQLNKYLR